MSATILASMKAELERLEGEHARWNVEYEAAKTAFKERLAPYNSHYSEISRLKQAIAVLEGQ